MNLPILWNQGKEQWCVYDATGKELWCGDKYAEAAEFADDYEAQQQAAAKPISDVINTGSVRG